MSQLCPSRRQVLSASAGIGAVALVGCGGSQGSGAASSTAGSGSPDLVALADVPVGEAVSVQGPEGQVIVAQTAQGEVAAFSAVCTHQGCTVQPDGDRLRCPCHGSVFEAATGRNVSGPAPRPLDPVAVRVVDGRVVAD